MGLHVLNSARDWDLGVAHPAESVRARRTASSWTATAEAFVSGSKLLPSDNSIGRRATQVGLDAGCPIPELGQKSNRRGAPITTPFVSITTGVTRRDYSLRPSYESVRAGLFDAPLRLAAPPSFCVVRGC